MPSKSEIRATYERIAESFASRRTSPWPEVLDFLGSLPRTARVLDLGCGHGRHLRPLAARGLDGVGLDFSRSLLEIGQRISSTERDRTLAWTQGDAAFLPFRDACFDACLCVAVLHHLPTYRDRSAALREIRRILRTGGRAIVSVWAREQARFQGVRISKAGDAIIPWTLPNGTGVGRYYHLFREGELDALIIESGLHGERFFRGAGNYFALATKHG